MSDNSITVDELVITPLETDYKLVHPAIGAVDRTAYIGVWFPCNIENAKGKTTIRDLLFLITSDRKRILANDSVLKERGWRLEYRPTRFKNRWTIADVKAYLNGADVNPAEVFKSVKQKWRQYIEFQDDKDYTYHTLWDIGTYFAFLFAAYPYSYHGGTKNTGKSKALTLKSLLCFNAILSNNMTPAAIFRLIQNCRATLLLDENEKLSTKQMDARIQEFRSILLSGYKRSGQNVWRVEKDKATETQSVVPFDVYGPKAIANIQGVEDILGDRCKSTIQRRSNNSDITKIDPDIENAEWATLRGQLSILFLQHWAEIKQAYDTVNQKELEELDGRAFELWKPIIAMAEFFDSYMDKTKGTSVVCSQRTQCSLRSLMTEFAKDTSKQKNVEDVTETGEAILIQVLMGVVKEDAYYSVKNLKDKVLAWFDEKPDWITTRWIGGTLKRLGFKDKRRVGTGYQYKLNPGEVWELSERMGVKELPPTEQPSNPEQKTLTGEHSEPSVHSERTTKVPLEKDLVANHCQKYRTGGCPHPNPDCIAPSNPCPRTCGDFEPQDPKKNDELVKGAASILNGTSGRAHD